MRRGTRGSCFFFFVFFQIVKKIEFSTSYSFPNLDFEEENLAIFLISSNPEDQRPYRSSSKNVIECS